MRRDGKTLYTQTSKKKQKSKSEARKKGVVISKKGLRCELGYLPSKWEGNKYVRSYDSK